MTRTGYEHPRMQQRQVEVENERSRRRASLLVAAVMSIVVVAILAAATRSSLLDVDEVRVSGAQRLPPEMVRAVADIELGTPLISLDLKQSEAALGAIPLVRSAVASRSWDGSVELLIVERQPVALFSSSGGSIVASADGVALANSYVDLGKLPVVVGATFEASPGDRLPSEVMEALEVASAIPGDIAELVQQVELSVGAVDLRLVGGGLAELGDARDVHAKIAALRSVLTQAEVGCDSTITLTTPHLPVISQSSRCTY